MPGEDLVLNDEVLYRRVPDQKGNYVLESDSYRVSSAAFGDRSMQPSVDRATLCENNPEKCRRHPTDFVASLVTHEVRSISTIPKTIDVMPDPIEDHPELPNNPAYALVIANPEFLPNEKTAFRKLRQALARLCKWEIPPPDLA